MDNSPLVLQSFSLYFSQLMKTWVCGFLLMKYVFSLWEEKKLPDNIFTMLSISVLQDKTTTTNQTNQTQEKTKQTPTTIHFSPATPLSLPREYSILHQVLYMCSLMDKIYCSFHHMLKIKDVLVVFNAVICLLKRILPHPTASCV